MKRTATAIAVVMAVGCATSKPVPTRDQLSQADIDAGEYTLEQVREMGRELNLFAWRDAVDRLNEL